MGETFQTCTTASVIGELTGNPDATGTATGKITSLTWGSATTPCKYPTTTVTNGALKIESEGGGNGNVYADAKIETTIQIPIFGSCIYGAEAGTPIGTIKEGNPSTLIINSVTKRLNANFACPETESWSGSYILTAPTNTTLYVSKEYS